ncbi:chorismate mutase [Candidatus Roizmanbacteria bacterium]|nr:MAG: chorismate mutase [Candidatus Roizmanbacteria bacterium]
MEINDLRKKIDEIDHDILILLSKRRDVVEAIGERKKVSSLPIKDETRFGEMIEKRKEIAVELFIPESVVLSIWDVLHNWALEVERSK